MNLAAFIRKYSEDIAQEWVEYARVNIEATKEMGLEEVRDHILEMLARIADDMDTSQTKGQQKAKSRGHKPPHIIHDMPAKAHGAQRVESGFNIVELSSEFRALRASVLRLWEEKAEAEIGEEKFAEMIRFNEAIDEAWMHSMARFHAKVDESKNWFLGVLGHDLRNPLSTISGAQQLLFLSPNLSDKEKELVRRSKAGTKRMRELINNLLELTSLRLGSGMSVKKSMTDLTEECQQILQELEVVHPSADLHLHAPGPVQGAWDRVRLNQVITNLVANALRHGNPGGPVTIKVSAKGNDAFFSVHNEGNPIPEGVRSMIFKGMFTGNEEPSTKRDNYGLGLYIVKEIVDGHGGRIDVESTKESGTTFTVILPRH